MTLLGIVLIGGKKQAQRLMKYRDLKLDSATCSDSCTSNTVYNFVNCSRSITWRPGLLSFNCPHGFLSWLSHCGQGSQFPSSSLKTVAPHFPQIICVTVPNAIISSPRPLLSM